MTNQHLQGISLSVWTKPQSPFATDYRESSFEDVISASHFTVKHS
jgi:hypothetical protein